MCFSFGCCQLCIQLCVRVCVCVMMGDMCFSFSFWIEILAVMRIVQFLKISVNLVDFLGGKICLYVLQRF
jgi:hypothetical protein